MAKDDIYLLTCHYQSNTAICQFGMHYRMGDGTYGTSTALAVCTKFVDDFVPLLLLALSDQVEIDQIAFNPIAKLSNELSSVADLNGADGAVVEEAMPANMCALIHLPTVAPNSKHNGRIYLSGVSEDAIVAGLIDTAPLALIQTFATKLFDPIVPDSPEDADFAPIVLSRFLDGVKRVPPVGFDILEPIAKNEPRQQQSRLTPRRGLA